MFSLLFCGKRFFQVRKLVLDLSQDRLSDGNFLSMLTNALLPLRVVNSEAQCAALQYDHSGKLSCWWLMRRKHACKSIKKVLKLLVMFAFFPVLFCFKSYRLSYRKIISRLYPSDCGIKVLCILYKWEAIPDVVNFNFPEIFVCSRLIIQIEF